MLNEVINELFFQILLNEMNDQVQLEQNVNLFEQIYQMNYSLFQILIYLNKFNQIKFLKNKQTSYIRTRRNLNKMTTNLSSFKCLRIKLKRMTLRINTFKLKLIFNFILKFNLFLLNWFYNCYWKTS
jgi:hypothetical protein